MSGEGTLPKLFLLLLCSIPILGGESGNRIIRLNGTIEAVRSITIQAPAVEGENARLTLATLITNGAKVHRGDVLAEFDRTDQLKLAREAQSKFDDLSHQVEQKSAEHKSNAEKRSSDLQGAEADLQKASIEIRKGPVLSDLEQRKNELKLEDAQRHVESLKRSNHFHELAEAAELHILELQRDRQKLAVDRQERNTNKLLMRAPIDGMVALENVFRNNSLGHAQEGDQLWPGSVLLRLFDPSLMQLQILVNEPDGAILVPGTVATVTLEAYPDLKFKARFDSASPVASASLGSPVKTFAATFLLEGSDPRLLPDLSASADVEIRK
jgi:HlyD family secretion protein